LIIPGKTMTDNLLSMAHGFDDQALSYDYDKICDADIHATSAFLDARSWQDPDSPGRPYLHIVGKCIGLRGELGDGVHGLAFNDENALDVDIFYEFSDKEISELVLKGLYHKGFKVPEIMTREDITINVPLACDLVTILPAHENDLPIVFADIKHRNSLVLNLQNSGYRFADYFEQVQLQPVEDKEEYIDEREFNEIETPEHEDETQVEEAVVPEVEFEQEPEEVELEGEYERIMTDGLAEKEAAEAEAQNEPEISHEAEGSDEQVTETAPEQEPERVDVQPFNEYPSSDEGFSY
jgi:hypothetical protein